MSSPLRHLIAATTLLAAACAAGQTKLPDIQIMDTGVFPESITSTTRGAVIAGSTKGVIYKAEPGSAQAKAWITPSAENGIISLLGVLADDKHNTLWVCSAPNLFGGDRTQTTSGVRAFDLESGKFKGRYDFPATPPGTCNDISIAPNGSAYASDTANGRIFRLKPGAKELDLVGGDPLLVGIDGLAFSSDGTLYANNVRSNKLFRVALKTDGTMKGLTDLAVSQALKGPDGMRLIKGNAFIQAESSSGRLGIVTVNGDTVDFRILRDDLESSPGATIVGSTAYVVKTNIKYLMDPALKGKEAPPAMIYAVPLP